MHQTIAATRCEHTPAGAASAYGQDCKTGASIVLLSCAGSILTVPVLYAIVQVLFG